MIACQGACRRADRLEWLLLAGLLSLLPLGCNRNSDAPSSAARPALPGASPTKATRDAEKARLALGSRPPASVELHNDETAKLPAYAADAKQRSAHDESKAESEAALANGLSADDNQNLSADRFALLLPRAPIVVELRMTIDGRPFRAADEKLVDDVLAAADRNRDGRATWGEVFADPKRILGPRYGESLKFSDRQEFMKDNDANRNGLVDRDEARRLVDRAKGSAAFLLDNSPDYRQANLRQSIVRALLDVNGDGALDGRELAGARQRLLVVDANDDHIVAWSELDDSLAADEQAMTSRKRLGRSDPAALLLGAIIDAQRVFDESSDLPITSQELRRLEQAEPQLVVAANFGDADDSPPELSLVRASPELGPVESQLSPSKQDLVLQFATCRIRFAMDDRVAVEQDALSMKSMEAMARNEPAAKARPPRLAAIQGVVCNEQDVLFSLLDANHDRRLTPRELRRCNEALRGIDSDGDGRVTLEEIPAALALWLGRGLPPETAPRRLRATALAAAQPAGPEWFLHMDANRDQEVSAQEFPGDSAKFRALDLDGDGFIVAGEAQAADSAARRQ
ncbi:MAG TPA: hypothetical protein VMV10_03040 [Pirellulales bacterium]|nr:hypothetical protein [Pirellulales bacterium]